MLFGKKKPLDTTPLISDEELGLGDETTYNDVLDYLSGLSADDYKKVIKCADITRKSFADQCRVLGMPNVPSTYINPPEPPTLADSTFTDDEGRIDLSDDDLSDELLVDENEPGGKKK